jgi:ABC-2 type transport system permease protein
MSIEADVGTSSAARAVAPATPAQTRPFAWSVRRELWEHRSSWIAPLAAAGFVLFGFSLSLMRMSHASRVISSLPPDKQAAIRMIPYGIAIAAIVLTSVIVGISYCLGTLNNERRDRSILFWKSMPVSDLTTVLAKASIPLAVLPLIAFVVICATQLVMLLVNTGAALANGHDAAQLWTAMPLLRVWPLVFYILATLALWYAPIYGWLLVVSGWARRGAFLWATLPLLALCVVEKLAFYTSWFGDLLKYRLGGSFHEAFVDQGPHPFGLHNKMNFHLPQADPAKFFSAPGLWLGLAAAAALFALAIYLRRRRELV